MFKLIDTPQSLSVVNPATNQALIFAGVPAALDITLTNLTGANIALQPGTNGSNASTMEIFMPSFFTLPEVEGMSITLANWTFAANPNDHSLMLTYAGNTPGSWLDGSMLF